MAIVSATLNVHPDNGALRERLASGALPLPAYFGQLLRLVYRLIFLLAAEDRNLLHPPTAAAGPRKLYADGYSVGCAARPCGAPRGLGPAPRPLGRIAHRVRGACERERRLGLPALGGLFAPGTIPDLRGRPARESRPDGGDLPPRLAQGANRASCRSIGATWRPRSWARSTRACSSSRPRLTDDGARLRLRRRRRGQGPRPQDHRQLLHA